MALCGGVDGDGVLKHVAQGRRAVVRRQQLLCQTAAVNASFAEVVANRQLAGGDFEATGQYGVWLGRSSVHACKHARKNDHDNEHRHQRANWESILVVLVEEANCNSQKDRNSKSNQQRAAALEEACRVETLHKVEGVVSKYLEQNFQTAQHKRSRGANHKIGIHEIQQIRMRKNAGGHGVTLNTNDNSLLAQSARATSQSKCVEAERMNQDLHDEQSQNPPPNPHELPYGGYYFDHSQPHCEVQTWLPRLVAGAVFGNNGTSRAAKRRVDNAVKGKRKFFCSFKQIVPSSEVFLLVHAMLDAGRGCSLRQLC